MSIGTAPRPLRPRRTEERLRAPHRELLDQLAGIGETVMVYPSTGGRPKARRMLTETTNTQDQLATAFNLAKLAPKKS